MDLVLDKPILLAASVKHDAAKAFYADVLDFRLVEDTPFAMVFDAQGHELRLQKAPAFEPHPFTTLGWHTDDIVRDIDTLVSRGVTFERYSHFPQDERGVMTFPGAQVAWFKDPDGNTLSLTQIG